MQHDLNCFTGPLVTVRDMPTSALLQCEPLGFNNALVGVPLELRRSSRAILAKGFDRRPPQSGIWKRQEPKHG